MNIEYLPAPLEVRQIYLNNSVETAWPNQCSIQQVLPIGCSHHNHVAISAESVHLHQDLVESVVPLIV